jgi:hypothetical protein
MTETKTRLAKLEKAARRTAAKDDVIEIWIYDGETHKRHGPGGVLLECLNNAEWAERSKHERVMTIPDNHRGVNEVEIHVSYADDPRPVD